MFKLPEKYFSLRARFLIATTAIILALTLSYGIVAIVGYQVSFDEKNYSILRNQSNFLYSLVQWGSNGLELKVSKRFNMDIRSFTLIYDQQGNILWRQRYVPEMENEINPDWLKKNGLYEFDAHTIENGPIFHIIQGGKHNINHENEKKVTYSIAVSQYPAAGKLPALTFVTIDALPLDIQGTAKVWGWFEYLLIANLLLVIPLIWLAADWSLRPIKSLIIQIRMLEKGEREKLDETPPTELKALVRNLNTLLSNERKRYEKYHTTLADLTHSLKTPLAVLQSTLRSLRHPQRITIEQAEPIMLEQIDRISQQIGYYLHRANMHSDHRLLLRRVFSVPILLDELIRALTKVYQHKSINITLDVSPEVTWLGEKNDFLEVVGNILDNACKYCLKLVKITATMDRDAICIIVDNDGTGIAPDKREMIFQRGLRADTLKSGQGLGLSIASEIVAQYNGEISVGDSPLGGVRIKLVFRKQ
ncbi:two-component system sensor histidine kinase PhoQ [Xenorhabdus sp. 42]|uniref:two-component system sensor histidine kinase PhoQ n=1 Tax=Xenorhabdus szentirmaii TaxID=290112 RepID=UPI00199EE65C|nr:MULTISPECIES: two-component system sensor histidine kinase PhoQ [unclassified Xenorhabdus]MBD2791073.1 two-component system sensor histidine kinase PhoQ [Xenorhabdus sp. CUL]MBD2819159.1 two-component system sensor histidine kinase PhoQ [Xenorhabdus sp. 42]MBD2825299.1 two-component system sensor histidine kinase PhoQ [Xenorhabdus sp. 5]